MNTLLEMVDALKAISQVQTHVPVGTTSSATASTTSTVPAHPQFAERRTTTKQPRKSRLQHRIITPQSKPTATNTAPLVPLEQPLLDQVLSPTSAMIPLRPLSISPARFVPMLIAIACSIVFFSSTDTVEENGSAAPVDFSTLQHRELERTTSIETLSVKSEPMETEEQAKRRAVPAQPPSSSSSSLSTKSFLISPPAQPHHHRSKTSIITSSGHFPPMLVNSNTAFAPRTSSNLSQKNTWPSTLPMNPATRQPPITAQKRPVAPPAPVYPSTAPRNSNATSSTMRMPTSTSLQPQSFDTFPINPSLQRRPNGIPLSSHTPAMSTRNPVRVSNICVKPLILVRNTMQRFILRSDALLRQSCCSTFLGRVSCPLRNISQTQLVPFFSHQTPGEVQVIIKTFNDKVMPFLVHIRSPRLSLS